jgi:hypothetical protein
VLLGALLSLFIGVVPASADHATRPHTDNLEALGHSPHEASFTDPAVSRHVNSDIAFWGNIAFNGNYDGFRVIDVSDPNSPVEISHPRCNGDQGDIVVWENILVRSWNSPAPKGRMCDGEPVPKNFEGLHIWDISNLEDPDLIGSLPVKCGSHTATLVPDLEDNRLLIYNQTSGGNCHFISIIQVPLDDPASASLLRREKLEGKHACHDSGVILGDVNMMACASGHATNVFDIGDNDMPGGSPEDPNFLYTVEEPGVGVGGNWHSAAWTWDGEVLILGWEPGGGSQAECEASDSPIKKSMFFYRAEDGARLGQWTLPQPQGPDENCTIHNYNIVPVDGRYIAVGGHYQAGTWVTDFTDPTNPEAVAWSDPPSLGPGPFCSATRPPGCQLGGAWSSYWYNGVIYESDITKGLNLFRLTDPVVAGALTLPHLNPQTQEFSLP